MSFPCSADGLAEVERLIGRLAASKKYRYLCEDTIRDVVAQELGSLGIGRSKGRKEAEARVRKRLHRVWAPYLGEPDFDGAERRLSAAFRDVGSVEETCREILAEHRSSRERIPILPVFYREIFQRTGVPAVLLDLACALNPLSYRWMGLPRSAKYRAYDINAKTVELINHYLRLEGMEPAAELRDVLSCPPEEPGDVALLLKMYHCLEHRRKGAGWDVIAKAPVEWVVASFPTRNLANRRVDIAGNYEEQIDAGAGGRGWTCSRMDFDTEIVLLLHKGSL